MSNLPQASQTTVPNISSTSVPNAMLTAAQVKKKKEDFLIFTRVLVKYLEQKDPALHVKVKAIIKDCADRNKRQEPGYESLTASLQSRLKAVVSDAYWKRAEAYLDHFLAQRQNTASESVPQQYDCGFQSSEMSLHLLYHAAKCPHVSNCPDMRFCRDTRMLWLHMGSCKYGGAICVYPQCNQAKEMLAHFQQSRMCTCDLCLPVRVEMRTAGATATHLLAQAGNLDKIKEIAAEDDSDLNKRDCNGWQPIHEAARAGQVQVLKYLLENGADVNSRTNDGMGETPLWWACRLSQDHPAVQLLRRYGAVESGWNERAPKPLDQSQNDN